MVVQIIKIKEKKLEISFFNEVKYLFEHSASILTLLTFLGFVYAIIFELAFAKALGGDVSAYLQISDITRTALFTIPILILILPYFNLASLFSNFSDSIKHENRSNLWSITLGIGSIISMTILSSLFLALFKLTSKADGKNQLSKVITETYPLVTFFGFIIAVLIFWVWIVYQLWRNFNIKHEKRLLWPNLLLILSFLILSYFISELILVVKILLQNNDLNVWFNFVTISHILGIILTLFLVFLPFILANFFSFYNFSSTTKVTLTVVNALVSFAIISTFSGYFKGTISLSSNNYLLITSLDLNSGSTNKPIIIRNLSYGKIIKFSDKDQLYLLDGEGLQELWKLPSDAN